MLQTYATQKKLELMGHKVEIIDYVRPNAEEDAMLKDGLESKHFGKNVLKSVAYVALKKIENIKRNKVCVNFLAQNVSLTRRYKDYDDLKKNPPVAEVYCTGSDQTCIYFMFGFYFVWLTITKAAEFYGVVPYRFI